MKGFGSILNIAPAKTYCKKNYSNGVETDCKNLKSDWEKVGFYLEKSQQQFRGK